MSIDAQKKPLVSIGLPVYNEARFLEQTLTSLLSQDYNELEVLLSDNASTDKTLEIARRFAKKDGRLKIHAFSKNQGARTNFLQVRKMARGTYLMMAGGHDLWSENNVSSCVRLLESNPGAVLAFGSSVWIDGEGEVINRETGYTDTRGLDAMGRFFSVFWGNMHPFYGVIRKSAIDKVGEIPNTPGGDLLFLAKLSLMGDFLHAPNAVWYRREFRTETSYDEKLERLRSRYSRWQFQRHFPLAAIPLELTRIVLASPLPFKEKILLLAAMWASFPARYVAGRKTP
ncbi:MAG: glycosyltransferase family 2 protein [Deltaproteobacteria bacterium]|nr:glycosyltransferase family 2 protein [Deltaproteobacteria bacterium]